jgi:hypothetical protein
VNPSKQIDKEIAGLRDWRGAILAEIRRLIHDADSEVTEEWKWMGTPVWCHDGNVCAADAHTNMVKVIFFKGAKLPDPERMFNAELEGNTRRAIKLFEGDRINERAFKTLFRAGLALNGAKSKGKKPAKRPGPGASQRKTYDERKA